MDLFAYREAYIETLPKTSRYKCRILEQLSAGQSLFSSAELFDTLEADIVDLLMSDAIERRVAEIDELCYMNDIERVYINDPAYPEQLKSISDPPFCLYYKGSLAALSDVRASARIIAMVGSRRISMQSAEAAFLLGYQAGEAGATLVSGFARGGDIAAHRGALAAGGASIAVLPAGLLRGFPVEHEGYIHELIKKGGALVSEYPPDQVCHSYLYPLRNRIISGLSQDVILFECAKSSGAIITLEYARRQHRASYVHDSAQHSPGGRYLIAEGYPVLCSLEEIAELRGKCRPFLARIESPSYIYSRRVEAELAQRVVRFGSHWYEIASPDALRGEMHREIDCRMRERGD